MIFPDTLLSTKSFDMIFADFAKYIEMRSPTWVTLLFSNVDSLIRTDPETV